jgi:hypothetical protein
LFPPFQHRSIALLSEIDVALPRRAGPFCEAVQNLDSFLESSEVEDSVLAIGMKTNLDHSLPNIRHGPKVGRTLTALNEFQLAPKYRLLVKINRSPRK